MQPGVVAVLKKPEPMSGLESAESTGLEATDDAALRRMDRRRKKKGSNEERVNPHDPEARSRACRYLV